MLKKKPPMTDAMTVIHEGTQVDGSLRVAGSIRIDGEIKGGISSEGDVFIGKGGKVVGDIFSRNATIEGELLGNLKVEEHALFTGSSSFKGELIYKTCEVEKGARINSTLKNEGHSEPEPVKEKFHQGKLLAAQEERKEPVSKETA
ncbi:bactofilin family protein [Thermicanus aegyptius]|uniref:bactofilin family protein n=1 Tax=Thermicanus aegyptius TaxID=94009 RepID=UPI0012EC985C|nr:polymer-forming cytoskeletal protein [Thermicanus aegyptius]